MKIWQKIILSIGVLLVIGLGIMWVAAKPAPDHPFFSHVEQRPMVMAHRGGAGLWPENTVYAFEHALAISANRLVYIVIHPVSHGLHGEAYTALQTLGMAQIPM